MSAPSTQSTGAEAPTERRLRYARILTWGCRLGLVLLLGAFALYAAGAVKPLVPLSELDRYWGLSAADYSRTAAVEHGAAATHGWGWITQLDRAEPLVCLAIAVLCALTILCYLVLLPTLIREKERILAVLVVCQLIVFLLAAAMY
jgi:hypothetical protein